ncbi:MAG TPA: histidine kinase, partial [Vibrio sp.]|nr:histidine kinase [Vibrio sp.]
MTNTTPQNNTLEQWIIQLDNTRLPVYKAHRERALQALQSPNKSLGDIAQVISQAPTIALIIMREANRASSSLAEPVQTLDNALSRLGLQRCAALLKDLQDDQETEIPIALRQVWLIGQHLNVQAMGLFGKRMARLWQEIHWGSLLFLSPAWPLLTRHPEFFSEWERRVLGDNESANAVEHELIGMPLITLCLGLAEHWKLPNWVIDGYRLLKDNPEQLAQALYIARQTEQPLLQQQMLDQMPALNSWLNRPANTIVFTCGLVMAAHNSWGSEQCVRWQRLISLYLNKELASVQQNTHRLAV